MHIINFAHPITPDQRAQLEALTGETIDDVLDVPTHLDVEQPFAEQIAALVEAVGLSAEAWQTLPLLVNPPGLAPAAVALLAELHGRMGHFPAVIRIRPVPGMTLTRYEVAEIINLQALREAARQRRVSRPMPPAEDV
jgi:hypothetical protein